MNLPKASALNYDSDGQDKRSALRIIKVEKKRNAGDVDLSKLKKKKATNWKAKKENLKRMVKLDLLTKDKRQADAYDRNRSVPREIHEQNSTEDELFLKIESGSQSTINTEASSRSKLENKLRNTKDKYMKYQTKAINKIKSFIPKSKSNENLKFMAASDLGKSRTLVAAERNPKNGNKPPAIKSKPPRPPLPANYVPNKCLLAVPSTSSGKPPIRPVRRKSSKNSTSNLAVPDGQRRAANLPAAVYYRELREKWLEKYASVSKSNLSSICSSSIPNYFDRKYSFLTNPESVLSDDFRYRYRAEYQSSLLLDERQSIKSEPTYAIGKLECFYIGLFVCFLFYFIAHFPF